MITSLYVYDPLNDALKILGGKVFLNSVIALKRINQNIMIIVNFLAKIQCGLAVLLYAQFCSLSFVTCFWRFYVRDVFCGLLGLVILSKIPLHSATKAVLLIDLCVLPEKRFVNGETNQIVEKMDAEVIIAGGGPTGLMLANQLGHRGIDTYIFEKSVAPARTSRAIGITPPSLEIMRPCGLDVALMRAGVQVQRAVIHGTKYLLGTVDFTRIAGDYPYILAVPQYEVETILRANLAKYPSVKVATDVTVDAAFQDRDAVYVSCRTSDKEPMASYSASLFCLCEGDKGGLRQTFGCNTDSKRYRDTFLMADFRHDSGLENDAHLFFTRYGAVESFPLPGGQRRWVVQTAHFMDEIPPGFLEMQVYQRTGFRLDGEDMIWQSPFGTKRRIESTYYKGRMLLAGDAAHVMPPIGGQGMNTGFMDACFLAQTIMHTRDNTTGAERRAHLSGYYESMRKKAAATAARRARFSMYVGTRKHLLPSMLRNVAIGLALHSPVSRLVAPHFAMLTIPYGAPTKDKRKWLFDV